MGPEPIKGEVNVENSGVSEIGEKEPKTYIIYRGGGDRKKRVTGVYYIEFSCYEGLTLYLFLGKDKELLASFPVNLLFICEDNLG